MHLTKREIASCLAGLRLLQTRTNTPPIIEIATNCGEFEPLAPLEIDALCERLNFDDPPDSRVAEALPGAVKRLLEVPEVRHVAANWASDELLAVRNLLHFSK